MIDNYIPSDRFSRYYYSQIAQLNQAIHDIDSNWEYATIIQNQLYMTKNVLRKMAEGIMAADCEESAPLHERKIEKYTTWIEVLRLAQYQYERYDQNRTSFSEGLYSSLLALAALHCKPNTIKKIAVLGCGPGRSVLDFARAFPDAHVCGMDYSLLSLVLADQILGTTSEPIVIPYRDVHAQVGTSATMILPSFGLKNYSLALCDLTVPIPFSTDLIICSNTVNLLPDHEKAISSIAGMLSLNGTVVFADLIGWRLDRSKGQTVLKNDASIVDCFERHGLKIIDSFSGGPYIERETADNFTIYNEHFFVGKKSQLK